VALAVKEAVVGPEASAVTGAVAVTIEKQEQ
jgi:hypothetical protein